MFITSVVMSAVATRAVWGGNEFRRLQIEIQAQRDVLRLETHLRKYLSQGVQMHGDQVTQGDFTTALEFGFLLGPNDGSPQDLDTLASMNALMAGRDYIVIGAFLREWGLFNRATAAEDYVSEIRPTGIFFVPPTAKAGSVVGKAGVLIIDDGGEGSAFGPITGETSLFVEPGREDLMFTGITELSVQKKVNIRPTRLVDNIGTIPDFSNPAITDGSNNGAQLNGGVERIMLAGYTIRFSMRFHTQNNEDMTFCPQADVGSAGCVAGAAYFDLEREVRVAFPNNNLEVPILGQATTPVSGTTVGWVMTRPLGFLHFFRPVFPDVWEN
jgi:hypothetical protein